MTKNKKEPQYFLPAGYTENPQCIDEGLEEYWNEKRIQSSTQFQFGVYEVAYRQMSQSGRSKMMDLGCGPATKHKYFTHYKPENFELSLVDHPSIETIVRETCPEGEFTGIDLDKPSIHHFNGQRFDTIIFADVVEHLNEPFECMQLIKRLLGENGLAYISTPERDRLHGPGKMDSGHPCHVREWNKSEFASFLEHSGFVVREHLILHQKRVSPIQESMFRILDTVGIRFQAFSCQLCICSA